MAGEEPRIEPMTTAPLPPDLAAAQAEDHKRIAKKVLALSRTARLGTHRSMTLTENMKQALRIAANAGGGIAATTRPDWRSGNVCAVRTAWALEKRGLIARQWTGRKGEFGSACYLLTSKGHAEAAALTEGGATP